MENIKKQWKNILGIVLVLVISFVLVYSISSMIFSKNNNQDDVNLADIAGYTTSDDYTDIKAITINNANFHNSIYRGDDVTRYYTDGSLYSRISSGEFTDLYVGDYIIAGGIQWRIAGFDTQYGKTIDVHHAALIGTDGVAQMMYASTPHAGGYEATLGHANAHAIGLGVENTFPVSHLLQYSFNITSGMTSTLYNKYGTNSGGAGAWTSYTVADKYGDLLNENLIFGTQIVSSTGRESSTDNSQFPIFYLNPSATSPNYWGITGGKGYWLRNMGNKNTFAVMNSTCNLTATNANVADTYAYLVYFYID